MASRDARDLESGVVASALDPSDASDWSATHSRIVRWPDTPGSYGSVSSRAVLAGLSEWRRGGFARSVDPKLFEETARSQRHLVEWAWRSASVRVVLR